MEPKSRNVPVIGSAELEKDAHTELRKYRDTNSYALLETGGYIVLRHAAVSRLYRDSRLRATETAFPVQSGITSGPLFEIFHYGMLTANDRVHERRRSGLSRALAEQIVGQFRLSVRWAAETLLDERYGERNLELARGFAAKLPVLALAGMLGIPEREVPSFMRDVCEMNEFFRPHATSTTMSTAEVAANRFQSFLKTLMTRKWAGHADDFLSHYLRIVETDQQLSSMEVLMQVVQLIIGGTESVRTAIVAQIVNLLSYREQWEAVCNDSTLVPSAVAESLRFEPGIAGVVRTTSEDIEIDGSILSSGQLIVLSSMSALRDERVFKQADDFNIFRSELPHADIVFGGGAHKCIADELARVELEECLSVLTERFPNLQLNSSPIFYGYTFIRGTTDCWVSW